MYVGAIGVTGTQPQDLGKLGAVWSPQSSQRARSATFLHAAERSGARARAPERAKAQCARAEHTSRSSALLESRAGDIYEKDVTMDAERYVALMTEKVLPAISEAYRRRGVGKVVVQHDGAPPHVGKDAEARINKAAKKLRPPIEIIRQPSQSPDTNICDLSFFRALASCVAKRRRGLERQRLQFDLTQLADDVRKAYAEYSVEKIDQMWAYKSVIMQKIIDAEGKNDYDKRRPKTGEKRARGE